jgi:hypothetical protein
VKKVEDLEALVDTAIATCDCDLRDTIRAPVAAAKTTSPNRAMSA